MIHFGLVEALKNPYKVTDLRLPVSKLTEIPKEIGSLTNLKELWLHSNYIQTLPKELSNLEKLDFLDLEDNPLINPSHQLLQLFSNRTLIINNNIVTVNPNSIPLKVYI